MNFDEKCSTEMKCTDSIDLFNGRRVVKSQPLNNQKAEQISIEIGEQNKMYRDLG